MANSKGRRKLQRLLRKAGPSIAQPQCSPAPEQQPHTPWWKKIHGSIYTSMVFLAIVITLAEGYPWLSIAEGERLNLSDPFSELFTATNEGYVPIIVPEVTCVFHRNLFLFGRNVAWNLQVQPEFNSTITVVGHGEKFTVPCAWAKLIGVDPLPGSTMDIKISYAFWPVSVRWLRRSQGFHLQTVGEKNSQHWQQF
jgi:hypothetical protein